MCGETKISIGSGGRRWADAIDAIFATDSPQIAAVDSKGTVLRVCQRADIDDAPAADDAPDAGEITATQRELAQVSQIIADAYSTAHDHARENSARGYELLAKFAELSFGRLAAIERAYGQLLAAHAKAIEADSANDAGLDSAIGGLVSHAMGGAMPVPKKAAVPPGNGKAE
jgi:hypothetical protein